MTQDPYGQRPRDGDEPGRWPEQPREQSDEQPVEGRPEAAWPGQPPPAGQPPAYGPPYPQPKQDDRALWALILALLGWIMCPVVAHIVALVLANQSLRAIRESNGWLTGEGMANAARIVAIVGLVLSLGAILVGVIAVAAFVVV